MPEDFEDTCKKISMYSQKTTISKDKDIPDDVKSMDESKRLLPPSKKSS